MKNLSIGINSNIQELEDLLKNHANYIQEVFVGIPPDIWTTGRKSAGITSIEILENIKRICSKYEVDINIVANTLDINARTKSEKFKSEIQYKFEELFELNPEYLTLADPELIKIISNIKNNKKPKINVSVYSLVDSPLMAEEFEKLGANRITFPQRINRDLKLIDRMIKFNPNLEWELYINSKCVSSGSCPYAKSHHDYKANTDEVKIESIGKEFDPVLTFCIDRRNESTIDNLFTPTIRPEDIEIYENLGINLFKIATRKGTQKKRLELARAYGQKSYEGPFGGLWTVTPQKSGLPNKALNGALDKVKNLYPEEQRKLYEEIGFEFEKNKNLDPINQIKLTQNIINKFKS